LEFRFLPVFSSLVSIFLLQIIYHTLSVFLFSKYLKVPFQVWIVVWPLVFLMFRYHSIHECFNILTVYILSENMDDCSICGSKFPTRECYFCQRKICTSCVVPGDVTGSYSTTKCVTCDRRKINKISIVSVLKRNKFILGLVAAFWIYAVFPLPFFTAFWDQNGTLDISAYFSHSRCNDYSVRLYVLCLAEKVSSKEHRT